MTPERLAELRKQAESFSGLQYVVTRSELQWPWTSAPATNQVVDLVRALPAVLDDLAAAETERDRLRAALMTLTSAAEVAVSGALGDFMKLDAAAIDARTALAGQPAGGGGGEKNGGE